MDRIVKKVAPKLPALPNRLRVAAYGRVSCDKDSMLNSLSAQVSYYSRKIQQHREWIYCGVYSDEGVTGTKDNRNAFQRMMEDCRAGKIDMIITKAVSRFARNTVTTLCAVRELKELGIDVFFEEQNIHTLSNAGELLLTILASYAQEESRSASENQKWRVRHGFEKGELINLRYMFGYSISRGSITINEKEAIIVREVFQRFISGESLSALARDLETRKIRRTFHGHWKQNNVRALLSNEKYMGNALLQKTFVNNHLEKRQVKNEGQLRQYYAENTHPAIVSPETFNAAQQILTRIAEDKAGQAQAQFSVFSGKIICGNCGGSYRRTTSRGKKYYTCTTYNNRGKSACASKRIPEDTLLEESITVLGLDTFDEQVFLEQIDHIFVPAPNLLDFHFRDGHVKKSIWQDRSRAESWTPEMKERARQDAIRGHQRRNNA